MNMIYTPEVTAKVFAAIDAIVTANNGYADIGNDAEVARAVELAGFVVICTMNLHGLPVFRGFTQAAQAALRVSPHGVSTYKSFTTAPELPDYEAAILARQDRAGELA